MLSPRRLAWIVLVVALAGVAVFACMRWQRRLAEEAAWLAELERAVAAHVASVRDERRLPGVSTAFALPDGRVGTAVAGFADVERRLPMTPDSRFVGGSVGKSFHAALALALDRDGVLDLDAPIARWLGEKPWFARLPNGRTLTLRHLLQHTSGLVDHLWTAEFFLKQMVERLRDSADALLSPEELIEPALDRAPRFAPGTRFAYGDTNYVLAGLVIEQATGRSAFDGIERRLTGPLGLDGIAPARTRTIPRLAAGYQLPINPFLLPPKIAEDGALALHPMNESTAGGLATTPRALVHWAKALFEERALPGPYLEELLGRSVRAEDGRHFGLGVYRTHTPLGEAWGHGGYFPGYRSVFLYLPERGVAVAVQTNRDFLIDVDALALEIAERVDAAWRRRQRPS